MVVNQYAQTRSATFHIGDPRIGCPQYRRQVLTPAIPARLKESVIAQAIELKARIETIEVMEEHVQVFVKANPLDSPHPLVKHVKGITSFTLRRRPTLWTRSYYVESVGHIRQAAVKQSMEAQQHK